MADRENEPTDLFDAVCRLDDLSDWLEPSYPDEARAIQETYRPSLWLHGAYLTVWLFLGWQKPTVLWWAQER